MPEIIFRSPAQSFCVSRVALAADAPEQRRDAFLKFVDAADSETGRWKAGFVIAGADYADYKYFYVISYNTCADNEAATSAVNRLGGRGNFGHIETVADSGVTGFRAQLGTEAGPVQRFLHYRTREEIAPCLVALTALNPADAGGIESVLLALMDKYRIFIVDVTRQSGEVYVLFGRQCDRRQDVLKQVEFLASREGFEMTQKVKYTDFPARPDAYLRAAQQGAIIVPQQ